MGSETFRARVARRIREERLAAGFSQEELARLVGGSNQVPRWEDPKGRFPSYKNIVALARALEISEEQLLCGCEPKNER